MVEQLIIFLSSCTAIWLISRPESWKRWGYIVGVLGQPFWIHSAYTAKQWGILLVSLFFVYSYGQGIWFYWVKKK